MKKAVIIIAIVVIIGICAVILITGIYIKTHPEEYRNKAVCEMFEKMKKRSIDGIISKKFEDTEHHLHETIIVNNEKIDIGLDISGFYEYVVPGDSVIKKADTTLIEVHRVDSELVFFILDYGCKEGRKLNKPSP